MFLAAEITKRELNKRITPSIEKLITIILLIGFIALTILWVPNLFIVKAEKSNIAINSIDKVSISNETKEPFDLKEFITWSVGIMNSVLLFIIGLKKVLGKG